MADNIRALVPQQQQFDDQQLEIIRKTVAIGLKPEQFLLFIEVCKHYRLNPMARQIYAYDNKGRMVVQTSIDGFRLMAERTGLYGGQIGPEWCGLDGVWKDVWLEKEPPAAARVGIIRRDFDKPIWGVARYTSYVGTTPIWSKAPDVMLAKCSESLGFRKAFPAEMSGIYTHEEMEQSKGEMMSTTVTVEQTEEDKKKARLNAVFKAGKGKGLFGSISEMAEYVSDVLQTVIEADDLTSLEDERLLIVEQSVGAAGQFAEAS
jgi:phage recombination protein Bet